MSQQQINGKSQCGSYDQLNKLQEKKNFGFYCQPKCDMSNNKSNLNHMYLLFLFVSSRQMDKYDVDERIIFHTYA